MGMVGTCAADDPPRLAILSPGHAELSDPIFMSISPIFIPAVCSNVISEVYNVTGLRSPSQMTLIQNNKR
jgi:hypothetical protein